MHWKVLLVLATLSTLIPDTQAKVIVRGFKRVCYYSGWANKRKVSEARMYVEDIDPSLCTHIIYAFAKINVDEASLEPVDWDDESTPTFTGNYEKLNDMKRINKNLKTLLSVGGARAGSWAFDHMMNDPAAQWAFVENAIDYLRRWKFDGLDVDWEFPGLPERGTTEETRYLFTKFMKDLREAFEMEAQATGQTRLLLTVAVGVGDNHVRNAYEPLKLGKYVDFLNLMAYDFHGGWDRYTGGNSPLYGRKNNYRFNPQLSQIWAVRRWAKAGVPAAKLILGIPAQGRTFTLKLANETYVGAETRGHGVPGPMVGLQGVMSTSEICDMIQDGGQRRWDEEQAFPYAYKDKLWVGYENPRSVTLKANWAVQQKLGGVMLWSLDLDDYSGEHCQAGAFPLARALHRTLEGRVVRDRAVNSYWRRSAATSATWRTVSVSHLTGMILLCLLSTQQ